MKLGDLRPCDKCAGPLGLVFYVVRSSVAAISADDFRRYHSMAVMFRGSAALAGVFADHEGAVTVAGEKDRSMWSELLLCTSCYCAPDLQVAALLEARTERENAAGSVAP